MDLGNATTSGVVAGSDKRTSFFPSVIASVGIGSYNGMSRIAGNNHHISYDGRNYIVGEEALHEMGAYSLLSNLGPDKAWTRYVSPESFACFLASVSAMYPDADAVSVRLATGAPLSIYQAHGEKIAQRYVGEHRYTYNGHDRSVLVESATCYGEGRETLHLVPREERMGKIAVHDLGGRTYNVVFFHNGQQKTTLTNNFGIELLLQRINTIDDDLSVRWQIMREMRENPKAHQDVRDALVKMLASAIEINSKKMRLELAEQHYLIGGGAFLLERALKGRYPNIRVLGSNPETANARAFALAMEGA
jgi:hypothetical protein